jgi:hypothetical protein
MLPAALPACTIPSAPIAAQTLHLAMWNCVGMAKTAKDDTVSANLVGQVSGELLPLTFVPHEENHCMRDMSNQSV